jgi:hypothetical protein
MDTWVLNTQSLEAIEYSASTDYRVVDHSVHSFRGV